MAQTTPGVTTDVLVVGAGPVGLSLAYQLRKFCSHLPPSSQTNVHIIEKYPKPQQEAFGRAVTFWPRSMEMLEQIGVSAAICQQAVAVRESAAYDAKGEEVFGRGWSFLEGIEDTRYKFATVLRQKYVEDIFRGKLKELGVEVQERHAFEGLEVDESIPYGGYRVTARIADSSDEATREYTVRCKYLIGCDGSRTVVRSAAGIESDGGRTEDKWVRIDGILKSTTMPKPRCYGAIESPIYGNVLWIPLDHGATRIGFALDDERRKLYPEGLTRDTYIQEAKLAVEPFDIEFERVDWASVYSVGQRVARKFWTKGCVLLAGDACHTHSSGAGQGMNAGQHDAVNLGWKLSLGLRGIGKAEELLETYDLERRPNAEKLIRYDEDISVLVSGRLPKSWKGEERDPNLVLGKILQEAKGFNTGLTIRYDGNLAVQEGSTAQLNGSLDKVTLILAPAKPGFRAPDVKLLLPALWEPVWLYKLTVNQAVFHIVIFAGDIERTRNAFEVLKNSVDGSHLFLPRQNKTVPASDEIQTNGIHTNGELAKTKGLPIKFITILSGYHANAWHSLNTDPLGKICYDGDRSAHERYGIDNGIGAVFIIRPDGWIGARYDLGLVDLVGDMEAYFGGILYI